MPWLQVLVRQATGVPKAPYHQQHSNAAVRVCTVLLELVPRRACNSYVVCCWLFSLFFQHVMHAQGWYSTPDIVGTEGVRTGEQQCESGYSCVNGIRSPCPTGTYQNLPGQQGCNACPAGYYGNALNETSANCTGSCNSSFDFRLCWLMLTFVCFAGPCTAGYWCSAGSKTPTSQQCGSASVYCPAGSVAAKSVQSVCWFVLFCCSCACV